MVDFTASFKGSIPKAKNVLVKYEILSYLPMILFSYFIGRVVILGFLNPFSIAFLCAVIVSNSYTLMVSISLLLGVFSNKNPELFLWHFLTIGILYFFSIILRKSRINKRLIFSIVGAFTSFVAGFFIFYLKNYYLYDILMLIMEAIMICALSNIYEKGLPLFTDFKRRRVISLEEMISIAILFSSLFLSTPLTFAGLSIKNIISIFLIFIFSFRGNAGAGALSGTTFGILQSLSGEIYSSAIGVYSLCGLLSGALKKYGRAMMIIAFITGNAIMTFYINGSTEVLIRFNEIILAAFLFLIIPEKTLNKIIQVNVLSNSKMKINEDLRIKNYTADKLNQVSDVFKELSTSINMGLNDKNYFSHLDAADIIDKTVKDICYTCGLYNNCWKKDFYRTYQRFFELLSIIESGELFKYKEGKALKDACAFPDKVWNGLRCNFNIYKSNHLWKKRINEGRTAYGQQMLETSKLIDELAETIKTNTEFDNDIESLLIAALDGLGIYIEEAFVMNNKNSMEIDIKCKSCGGKRKCVNIILPEIKKLTGKDFVKVDSICRWANLPYCSLKLKEVYKYSIITGFAKKQNPNYDVSGDNFSFVRTEKEKFFMILSDGMGCGYKAAIESSIAVNLLEKFLYAGYEQNAALEAINSFLLIKSSDENYATMDISIINQYTGEVEFLKAGAVSTFIKEKNRVGIIKNSSLPAGILNNIDIEISKKKLGNGDFVIMLTDGALDANKNELDKEGWLADIIESINTGNPQKLADFILQSCLEKSQGIAEDDITVLVAKLWEPR